MLRLSTPYGDRYIIHDNGNIERADGQWKPSDQWKMVGLVSVSSGDLIPLEQIDADWLQANSLTYKNGDPRFAVADLDHGTYRVWGNTKVHGVRSIEIVAA